MRKMNQKKENKKLFEKHIKLSPLATVRELTDETFKEGHGGGNWRRLLIQFKEALTDLEKEKSSLGLPD